MGRDVSTSDHIPLRKVQPETLRPASMAGQAPFAVPIGPPVRTTAGELAGLQPLVYRCDLDRRLKPHCEFVEPGRRGPMLLETADPAFDCVPRFVVLTVESGWTATAPPRRLRLRT